MKQTFKSASPGLVVTLTLLCIVCSGSMQTKPLEPVAVVELFTSEGCSSCPAADRVLTELAGEHNNSVFTLAYHVDYWNRLGWRDSFSSSEYSDRQRRYGEALQAQQIYTPQAIVNGTIELVGSESEKLHAAIDKALHSSATAAITKLSAERQPNNTIIVNYSLEGAYKNSTVCAALVAIQETTYAKRGENIGRKLLHSNIVRQLKQTRANTTGQLTMDANPMPRLGNAAIILFVQRNADLHIIAAAKTNL